MGVAGEVVPPLLVPLLGGGSGEGLDRELMREAVFALPFLLLQNCHHGQDLPSTAESQMNLPLFSLLVFLLWACFTC